MGDLLSLLFVIGVWVVGRWIAWGLDRDRIRECIESCEGKVLDIAWNPMGSRWFGNNGRIYDVRYQTPQGEVCEATCQTMMFARVIWINTVPPGLPAARKKSYVSGETITGLKCEATVPAGQLHCNNCGWSYMAGQQELS